MLFLAAGMFALAFVALAYIGIMDARTNLRRFERELQVPAFSGVGDMDALDDARFSASLLSLSKVPQLMKHSSPEPVHDESSSLVLVRPAQSKSLLPRS